MSPYLPGEITDAIIGLVWPDRATMLNCALVCRQWLPTSRHHLFSEIEIRSSSVYDHFIERILQSDDMKSWLSSVRRFTFVDQQLRARINAIHLKDRSGRAGVFVHDLADQLPNLESLSLTIDWLSATLHSGAFDAFASFTMRDLILDSCQFSSFEDLCRILTTLPNLERLRLRDVTCPPATTGPAGPSVAVQRTRPALRALDVAACDLEVDKSVFVWLSQTPSRTCIRNLAVTSPVFAPPLGLSMLGYADCLRRLAEHVVVLRLGAGEQGFDCEVPMRDFVNLKRLTIEHQEAVNWTTASYFLSRLQSSIEHLTLHLRRGRKASLRDQSSAANVVRAPFGDGLWALDSALDLDAFNGLKSVEFHLDLDFGGSRAWDPAEVERRAMPKFREDLQMLAVREISTVHITCQSRGGEPRTLVVNL